MKRMLGAGLVLALSTLGASAADAQLVPRPVRFGLGGGLSGVTGNLADAVDPGFHLMAALDVGIPLFPVGVRVDGAWHSFKGVDDGPDMRIVAATANATLNLLPLPILKPYAIGGVGMYNRKLDVEDSEATTKMGFNAGVGLRFDLVGFGAFAEARYHLVGDDDTFGKTNFYPITVGLRF